MNNIETVQQLREEILRLRLESKHRKVTIKNSFENFKKSLTPLNIIITILGELKHEPLFNTAITAFEKVREFFRKKF